MREYLAKKFEPGTEKPIRSNLYPPGDAPVEFWLDVLHYQKLYISDPKRDFSIISAEPEDDFDDIIERYNDGEYKRDWIWWMLDEIGWFNTPTEDELRKIFLSERLKDLKIDWTSIEYTGNGLFDVAVREKGSQEWAVFSIQEVANMGRRRREVGTHHRAWDVQGAWVLRIRLDQGVIPT